MFPWLASLLFVYPTPATGFDPGVHPLGSALRGSFWSIPLTRNAIAPGTENSTALPSIVSAAGKLRLGTIGGPTRGVVGPTGATRYCNVFWLPLGKEATEVISSACTAAVEVKPTT